MFLLDFMRLFYCNYPLRRDDLSHTINIKANFQWSFFAFFCHMHVVNAWIIPGRTILLDLPNHNIIYIGLSNSTVQEKIVISRIIKVQNSVGNEKSTVEVEMVVWNGRGTDTTLAYKLRGQRGHLTRAPLAPGATASNRKIVPSVKKYRINHLGYWHTPPPKKNVIGLIHTKGQSDVILTGKSRDNTVRSQVKSSVAIRLLY